MSYDFIRQEGGAYHPSHLEDEMLQIHLIAKNLYPLGNGCHCKESKTLQKGQKNVKLSMNMQI